MIVRTLEIFGVFGGFLNLLVLLRDGALLGVRSPIDSTSFAPFDYSILYSFSKSLMVPCPKWQKIVLSWILRLILLLRRNFLR